MKGMSIFREWLRRIVCFAARVSPWGALRDFFLWPVFSRLVGVSYIGRSRLKNGYVIETGAEDILCRFALCFPPRIDPFWEPRTTRLLRELVPEKRTILIAGAHIGYFSLEIADLLHPEALVHTFEPIRALFERTAKNIELNGLANRVKVFPEALTENGGEIEMSVDAIRSTGVLNGAKSQLRQKVRSVSLPLAAERSGISMYDLIVLDIEGFEYYVLRGARDMLSRTGIEVIFEFSPSLANRAGVEKDDLRFFMESLGYEMFLIEDDYDLKTISASSSGALSLRRWSGDVDLPDIHYYNIFATRRSEKYKDWIR